MSECVPITIVVDRAVVVFFNLFHGSLRIALLFGALDRVTDTQTSLVAVRLDAEIVVLRIVFHTERS